jgi:hypothetical protein
MIKRLLFIIFILFAGCTKDELLIEEIVDTTEIGEINQDGQEISFEVQQPGTYTLILLDSLSNTILSKENVVCTVGTNKFNIYTKSLPTSTIEVKVQDKDKKEVFKKQINLN